MCRSSSDATSWWEGPACCVCIEGLVQSDVYRRSAVKSADQRGRSAEGPRDFWHVCGWAGRSVGV
ncbi:unnamed protein product [Ectocarpus fasciculatus]